jgi:hypothetical protein
MVWYDNDTISLLSRLSCSNDVLPINDSANDNPP